MVAMCAFGLRLPDVVVSVDEARAHNLTRAINDSSVGVRRFDVRSDLCNEGVNDQHRMILQWSYGWCAARVTRRCMH